MTDDETKDCFDQEIKKAIEACISEEWFNLPEEIKKFDGNVHTLKQSSFKNFNVYLLINKSDYLNKSVFFSC